MSDKNIRFVEPNSTTLSAQCRGKWYCSSNQGKVFRYLGPQGWQNFTHYFDTREEIESLLLTAGEPDFTESISEHSLRLMFEEDCRRGFEDL